MPGTSIVKPNNGYFSTKSQVFPYQLPIITKPSDC